MASDPFHTKAAREAKQRVADARRILDDRTILDEIDALLTPCRTSPRHSPDPT